MGDAIQLLHWFPSEWLLLVFDKVIRASTSLIALLLALSSHPPFSPSSQTTPYCQDPVVSKFLLRQLTMDTMGAGPESIPISCSGQSCGLGV